MISEYPCFFNPDSELLYQQFQIPLSFMNTKLTGPILESKGMCAIFQIKGKKKGKKGKIIKNLGKNVQNLKYFEKGQVIACDAVNC